MKGRTAEEKEGMSEGGVAKGDPSSSCNSGEALVKHVHWRADVDFSARILRCSAQLSGKVLTPACSQLVRREREREPLRYFLFLS